MEIERNTAPDATNSAAAGYPRNAVPDGKVVSVKRRRPFRTTLWVVLATLGLVTVAGVVAPAGADQLSDKKAEAASVADKLAALDSRAMELNAQYEQARFELSQIQGRLDAAKVLSQQTAAEADSRRDDLRQYAVAAYQTGNDSPEFDALITNDAETGVQKRSYLQTISGSRQDLVDALNAAKQKADEDAVREKKLSDEASSRSAEIEQMKNAADAAAGEQRALNSKVQGELKVLVDAENARRAAAQAEAQRAAMAARNPGGGGGSSSAPNPNAPRVGQGGAGAIAAGMTKMGAPYVWAAAGPDVFDCSGFVQWAYKQVGVSLSHYSGAMYNETVRISESQLQPGDLVFWGPGGSQHVAIYIGGNQILHTAHGVAITAMNGWWTNGPTMSFGRIA